jgi:hypothetical protein
MNERMTINTEQFMKKLFLLFLFSAFMVGKCLASDFNDGTLSYTILSGTTNVQVDGLFNSSATTATIPATVINSSTTYNVTSIKGAAFYSCAGLKTVDLSQATNLQTIGNSAFNSCTGLTSFVASGATGLTSIGNNAFYGCTGLTSFDASGATGLTSIGNNAFNSCSGLTTITIPASVTSIGESAFNSCTGLKTVDLSQATNLQTIGASAFFSCTAVFITTTTAGSLAAAVKYNALTSIGNNAFYGCTGLTSFDISGATGLTSIGDGAFSDCAGLTSFTISASVTSIGTNAFSGCTGLTSFDISGATGLTSIGIYAFYSCTGLTTVTIPTSVTSIGESAFYCCTGLTTVDLSQATNLQTIGANAFNDCTAATFKTTTGSPAAAVKYNALISIGNGAFRNCTGLTSFDASGATGLTSIGESTFYGCTGLTTFTIPASVTSIGNSAFFDCSGLTTVTIPASVTSIGESAFYTCSNLTSVYMESTVPPTTLGTNIFDNCNSNLKFYINDGTTDKSHISKYITATSAWTSGKITNSNTVPYLPKTVTAAKVATLYLPYEVTIPSGVEAYSFGTVNASKTYISLTPVTGTTIPAGTPVLLQAEAGKYNFYTTDGTISENNNNGTVKGTAADITNNSTTESNYLTLGKKTGSDPAVYGFYRFTGSTIAANTCYVPYSSVNGAKGIDLNFGDESTAINDITNSSSSAADVNAPKVIYDLTGRRVNAPQRGSLYIVNGKKVIF